MQVTEYEHKAHILNKAEKIGIFPNKRVEMFTDRLKMSNASYIDGIK